MRIRTVFLDAGGVLVYPNWARISGVLETHGVKVSPDLLARAEPYAKRKLDVSQTITTTTDTGRGWLYFNLILEQAGVRISNATDAALAELHAYHMTSNLWEHVPPYVPGVLEALVSRGLTLVIVSNANGTLRDHVRRLGLEPYFHTVLDSCDEGVEKPDPRLFEIGLHRSGSAPAETIHVGDLYEVDVVGSRAAGITGVLLDEAGLYVDADCPRIRALTELTAALDAGQFG